MTLNNSCSRVNLDRKTSGSDTPSLWKLKHLFKTLPDWPQILLMQKQIGKIKLILCSKPLNPIIPYCEANTLTDKQSAISIITIQLQLLVYTACSFIILQENIKKKKSFPTLFFLPTLLQWSQNTRWLPERYSGNRAQWANSHYTFPSKIQTHSNKRPQNNEQFSLQSNGS